MSLCVDVFLRDTNGERRILDVPDGWDDSAGFEVWRTTVWGSEAVRSLGARLLPVLADGDLWLEAGEVASLLEEVAVLRTHLELIATRTQHPRGLTEHREQLEVRLRIIEAAALRARELGGGIVIW
ncbi:MULTISPECIES: hypothetical protein [Streptomyces]|uniref:Uncharacterized protein n=2 Tax=Streptomyces TaxID=1883 RepID=A0ABV9IWF5_9ACTN